MEIKNKNQLNQGIDQYKLLSTASGVGALVSTKMGFFIMPLTIDEWGCIKRSQEHVSRYPNDLPARIISDEAVSILDDARFINYLKDKESLQNLKYLVAIPHIQLDRDNKLKIDNHPLYKKYLSGRFKPFQAKDYFNIPGIVFPRWLFNPQTHELCTYEDWQAKWKGANKRPWEFAPPKEYRVENGIPKEERLRQMHLVLICENGHISDIPWDCFFAAYLKDKQGVYKSGYQLFRQNPNTCNGHKHKLIYLENENHSDGWGLLMCETCHEKVPLDGIMNLKPECSKEMPWMGINRGRISIDSNSCTTNNSPSTMRVALVTSHSTYYADTISSLFIPQQNVVLSGQDNVNLSAITRTCLDWLNNAFMNNGDSDKQSFVDGYGGKDLLKQMAQNDLAASGLSLSDSEFDTAFDLFMTSPVDSHDKLEGFRYEEYQEFTKENPIQDSKLKITDVEIPQCLSKYFSSIRQVHTLCLTKTQLGFFRGKYRPPVKNGNQIVYPQSMSLSGHAKNDIYVYPALQEYGEGLFFELNKESLEKWSRVVGEVDGGRYSRRDYESQANLSVLLDRYSHADWFYLLHTFAHVIIKELEFSCGYPSDNLSERIYYSDRMCGVLIYTVDGAEGGMGGLVWQGRKEIIETIVTKAMKRANLCSSDPICWQHTEDSMNYAACFSCAMVSETSCEYGNNGLDRRALVDGQYGFFKDLV